MGRRQLQVLGVCLIILGAAGAAAVVVLSGGWDEGGMGSNIATAGGALPAVFGAMLLWHTRETS